MVWVGGRVALADDVKKGVFEASRRRDLRVEVTAQRGQHVELRGLGTDAFRVGRFDSVSLFEQVGETGSGAAKQVLQNAAGLGAVGGREVIGVLRPPLTRAGEQPVEFDQGGQIPIAGRR